MQNMILLLMLLSGTMVFFSLMGFIIRAGKDKKDSMNIFMISLGLLTLSFILLFIN